LLSKYLVKGECMVLAVPKESFPGETRVALVPAQVQKLVKAGHEILIEKEAGYLSGYTDDSYVEKGAKIVSRSDVFSKGEILLTVRSGAAAGAQGAKDAGLMKEGQIVIGMMDPWQSHEAFKAYADKKVTSFALELIPRITRAQSMDVLSSMANLAGYKSVLIGANHLPKMFPMMMTAAGTIVPAKVFIVGVGVAGLQAIATAKRLGAVVSAYDVRPAVKEQVESLGARFVDMDLETDNAEGSGGYAREMNDEFYRKQREFMTGVCSESDVVITTAAIPGKKSPVLVTEDMVKAMKPGSVIVDLAVERGGNCELSEAGKSVTKYGVHIVGPENIPAGLAFHASQLYGKNIETFLLNFFDKEGNFTIDTEDEIVAATLLTRDGQVPNEDRRAALGL
jgi:NAD(P) transhydrogenase subunit alpha